MPKWGTLPLPVPRLQSTNRPLSVEEAKPVSVREPMCAMRILSRQLHECDRAGLLQEGMWRVHDRQFRFEPPNLTTASALASHNSRMAREWTQMFEVQSRHGGDAPAPDPLAFAIGFDAAANSRARHT